MPQVQDTLLAATPLTALPGVADQTIDKLHKLKLFNFYDLVLNLPFRYEDRTYIQALSQDKEEGTPCNLLLTITTPAHARSRVTEFGAVDHEGTRCKIVFFHVPQYVRQILTPNTRILCYTAVRFDSYSMMPSITQPEFQLVDETSPLMLPTKLSPVYHLTAGITQRRMRTFEDKALAQLVQYPLKELIPENVNPYGITLTEAFLTTHNPDPRDDHGQVYLDALPSFQRICFEELVAYRLCILELKSIQESKAAPAVSFDDALNQEFISTLPFTPTNAQMRVVGEIMSDVSKEKAMSRLVNGDVGSGKTLVAAMVILQFAKKGLQCAMLAPTDILAKQHHAKLSKFFSPMGLDVVLISGSLKKKERDLAFKAAKEGAAQIFVGTHALFQKGLSYKNLALAIIDEQHRFGVEQREALLAKAPDNISAHELLMTATPIPRSLQQALFSDTDVSNIDELPAGRTPITTAKISMERCDDVVARLRAHCVEQGNQAYWVCPLVEESETFTTGSARKRYEALQAALPELKIGILHAQLSEREKNKVMNDFINNDIQILVATTIVEVGVDVPNATVIVIESAERLGLAQLHQLRGRVGRGDKPSFCILLFNMTNKHDEIYERGMQRIEIMRNCTDGFEIANKDLLMRGAGEYFGSNQAGEENLRFADLNRDHDLVASTKNAAFEIFNNHRDLAHALMDRWFHNVLEQINDSKAEKEALLAQSQAAKAIADTTSTSTANEEASTDGLAKSEEPVKKARTPRKPRNPKTENA